MNLKKLLKVNITAKGEETDESKLDVKQTMGIAQKRRESKPKKHLRKET